MKAIKKRGEPRYLIEYHKQGSFDLDSQHKSALGKALVTEQRGLCCYCMGKISAESGKMKIEHWRSRANFPEEQAVYRNLLAACLGGQGRPRRLQHCDTYKKDACLKWNPADPIRDVENWILYELDGTILSSDEEFNDQLSCVLNLNVAELRNRRRGVIDGILAWWRHERNKIRGQVSRSTLVDMQNDLTGGVDTLDEYCQVAVWWLEQRIKRQAA